MCLIVPFKRKQNLLCFSLSQLQTTNFVTLCFYNFFLYFLTSLFFLLQLPNLTSTTKDMEAQEFFQTSFCPQSDNTNNVNTAASDHFIVEDLFDFSNDDAAIEDPTFEESPPTNSNDSPPLETNPTSNFFTDNSCQNSADGPFSGELSVPVRPFYIYRCL